MQSNRTNLNLFVALNAILNSRSLTQAAGSMHLTQSALSTSLRKLREHFGDPLISYSRDGTELTPLGAMLQPRVAELLQRGTDVLKLRDTFEPSTSRIAFRIRAIDSAQVMLFPSLVRLVAKKAPHVRISSSPIDFSREAAHLHKDCEVALIPEWLRNPELKTEVLFLDELVGVIWRGHRDAGKTFNLKRYRGSPHAVIEGIGNLEANTDRKTFDLAHKDIEIALVTQNFSVLVQAIIGTELIGIIPRRVASVFEQLVPIRTFPLPFHLPKARLFMQWQDHKAHDPSVAWLLEMIRRAAKTVSKR